MIQTETRSQTPHSLTRTEKTMRIFKCKFEFQSAAKVIILNYFSCVARNKPEAGVSGQKDGSASVILKRRMISTRPTLPPSVPLLPRFSLALPLIFFKQSPGPERRNGTRVLRDAPRGDGYRSVGRCTPTLRSHVLHGL